MAEALTILKGGWDGPRMPVPAAMKQMQIFADDPVTKRIYKIPRWRTALVKEGAIPVERKQIRSPVDVFNAVGEYLADADREYFLTLMLSTKNNITGVNVASIGTLNSSLVHPREVFKAAILANAASVVLVHVHPSGDPTPSAEDLEITKRLVEAGKIIGIEIIDHVVIGDGCWASLKERGNI
jgi:DNA repair protein RadC